MPVAATLNEDVIALAPHSWMQSPWFKFPSLLLVAASLTLLYKLALRPEPKGKRPAGGDDKPEFPTARVVDRED